MFFTDNRGRHIIIADNLFDGDAIEIGKFCGHIEIDNVATVIAIDVENASALIDSLGDLIHLFRAWRLEDAADSRAIDHAFADIAQEQRQVA